MNVLSVPNKGLKKIKLQGFFFFFKKNEKSKAVGEACELRELPGWRRQRHGGSSPCLLQGGGAHRSGSGAAAPWQHPDHTAFLQDARAARADRRRPRTPRSHACSPESRARPEVSSGFSNYSDYGVQGSTVKTHNLRIQTSVKKGCLMGKKSQSQNIWPHGNRQWQGIFLYNKTRGLIHIHRNSHNSTETI